MTLNHLILCREFPPARGGGIGTYALNASRSFADNGETLHVVTQFCEGADKAREETCNGKVIVHRVPFDDWTALLGPKPYPALLTKTELKLFHSCFYPQCFSWSAAILIEKLIQQEGIDVIEAQEYEAPLYYFQLRRALGLGPTRQPPCFVHLHSPSQLIARHNDWEPDRPALIAAARLEEFSIRSADALLCPSRYLARQSEQHYRLATSSIEVIHYPHFERDGMDRADEVWRNGTICYVGRLERRKGVLEWIKTAVSVAEQNPDVCFDFVGENVLGNGGRSGRAIVADMIPKRLRQRFQFHGPCSRAAIPGHLNRARIVVVPSRWENFPYTCIEAMRSGTPVLATATGGMAEMIENNQTGWLAETTNQLTEAFSRALNCSPTRLKEMGSNAQASIRDSCNPDSIFEQQMDFRKRMIARGADRSLRLTKNLDWFDPALFTQTNSCVDSESMCDITQVMIEIDGSRMRSSDHSRISPLRVAMDSPIRTGTIAANKLRGKFQRYWERIK
ncbi:glycosyltransferase family 4 protein [bacterium]|nr:glycosyltransferase family 4 protein [bacterium]